MRGLKLGGVAITALLLAVPYTATALDGLQDFEFWDAAGQQFRFEFLGSMLGAPLEPERTLVVTGKEIAPSDLTLVFRIRVLSQGFDGVGLGAYGLHTSHAGVTCPPFGPQMRAFGYPVVAAGWLQGDGEGDGVAPSPFQGSIQATEWCAPGDTSATWYFRFDPVLENQVSKPLFVTLDSQQGAGGALWVSGIGLLPFVERCDDRDLDRICSDADPCVSTPNIEPFADVNRDGVPDECQCGDPNSSGSYESQDLFEAHSCLLGDREALVPPCSERINNGDTDNDGFWSSADLFHIYKALTGGTPGWALTCPVRPEGEAPPVF